MIFLAPGRRSCGIMPSAAHVWNDPILALGINEALNDLAGPNRAAS